MPRPLVLFALLSPLVPAVALAAAPEPASAPAPEPAGWIWKDGKPVAAPVLVGVGEVGEEEVVSSFELR